MSSLSSIVSFRGRSLYGGMLQEFLSKAEDIMEVEEGARGPYVIFVDHDAMDTRMIMVDEETYLILKLELSGFSHIRMNSRD